MIPACFSSPESIPNSSKQMAQNLVTCIYQTHLCNSPTYLTLTWSKTLFSHTLTIHAPEIFSITIPLFPSAFPFFRARPGSKSVYLTSKSTKKLKLYWDFSRAGFSQQNSAEPESGFYFAIASNSRMEFFLGDRFDELTRRAGSIFSRVTYSDESTLLSRREHVFGGKSYVTQAQVMGLKHEIGIDCGGGVLKVKVDGETKLVVKRLVWKFRGNEKITVGGVEVEFYWDVFNWINKCGIHKNGSAHGVFFFQIGDGGLVWPEMVGAEKKLMRKSLSSAAAAPAGQSGMSSVSLPLSPTCSSVLQWAEESASDCGRSSCSSSRSCGSAGGFSLLLYAWRKD